MIQITTMMSIDESAAFDCIHFSILSQKIKMYTFEDSTIAWFESYLQNRSQYAIVGTKSSSMKTVTCGMPQGSVLWPLLYNLYTNEVSITIEDTLKCNDPAHEQTEELFGPTCPKCGQLPYFADDTTYLVSNKHRESNQSKLTENLRKITEFLTANKLTINQTKTTLMEFMIHQKQTRLRYK